MDSALFPQLAESSALLELEELDAQDGTSAQQSLASALRLCGRNLAPLPTVADQASASTKSMHSPAPLQTSFYVPLQPGLIETPATSYSKKGLQYAVDRNRQQATK
jgi:hypothetical protein